MDVNEFGQNGKAKRRYAMPTIGIENSEQIRTWETAAYAPTRYTELDQQYIGGIWRCGKEGRGETTPTRAPAKRSRRWSRQTGPTSMRLTNRQQKRKSAGQREIPRSAQRS